MLYAVRRRLTTVLAEKLQEDSFNHSVPNYGRTGDTPFFHGMKWSTVFFCDLLQYNYQYLANLAQSLTRNVLLRLL
jgi:hypothetical protein